MLEKDKIKEYIFYIDPQSYNNLSLYDTGVLSRVPKGRVILFGSILWNSHILDNVNNKWVFNYNNISNTIIKGLSYTWSLCKIYRDILVYRPKLIHIQWIRNFPIDWFFLKLIKLMRIKIIYTAHNLLPHDTGNKYFYQFLKYYNSVDHIIVHSTKTKEELIEKFLLSQEKISVIPHGILRLSDSNDSLDDRIKSLKDKYNLNNKLILSSLGAQTKYKGVDNIIDVWKNNPELYDNPNLHLLLIGKNYGLDYSQIRKFNNVTIIDERISNHDFQSFINLTDVILLPYRTISQSGVLFSAIENNIPVLVSDVGGLPEPLKYGKVGWCIGPPTYENLRNSLFMLISNHDEIFSIKGNIQEFDKVKSYYSWDLISDLTISLYNKIIKN